MLKQLETQFPKAIRPKQLRALALTRRAVKANNPADLDEAQEILAELYAAGERDADTLGTYARTWWSRYELHRDAPSLRKSRDLYAEAFDLAPDDFYMGINGCCKKRLPGHSPLCSKCHSAKKFASVARAQVCNLGVAL
jgi:hypothetical protein